MSSGLAHQRVLRTVRLLPQAVKIGILESEIKQAGSLQSEQKQTAPERKPTPRPPAQKVQVKIPERNSKEIEELTAQVKALTNSLSNAEVENAELTEAKKKLESEIGGIKSDYEKRRRTLESEAQANAKKIADKAREQAISEGQVKGYEEGLQKARAEVEQEYLEKFSALAGVIENVGKKLDENFAELVQLHQPQMIRMWTRMLERMLHRQVELNPDTIDSVLSELLSRLSDKNQILIYVSPDDLKHVEGELDTKFHEALRGAKRVELKADPNVQNGSCIVETSLGVYDARWKTQMAQIESVVDEIFQQSSKVEK
ncbi:MAG: hypothetical protein IJS40_02040 [Synergistaceae bacterium]|nr:hypothetical protein [Synergistaceae bacterium]